MSEFKLNSFVRNSSVSVICDNNGRLTLLLSMFFFSHLFFRYVREFGFTIEHRPIVIDDIIVKGVAKSLVSNAVEDTNICTDDPLIEKVNYHFYLNRFKLILISIN